MQIIGIHGINFRDIFIRKLLLDNRSEAKINETLEEKWAAVS